jgi:hypothetical protein
MAEHYIEIAKRILKQGSCMGLDNIKCDFDKCPFREYFGEGEHIIRPNNQNNVEEYINEMTKLKENKMFKVGDEIMLRGKVVNIDNDNVPYQVEFYNDAWRWFRKDLEQNATLIDPNEPQWGQEVWVRDNDEEWRKETRYYVGRNPKGKTFITVNNSGGFAWWDEVTTQNPFANTELKAVEERIANAQKELEEAQKELKEIKEKK